MGEYSEEERGQPQELCHPLRSVFVSYRCVRTKHADSVMGGTGCRQDGGSDLSWACAGDNGMASSPLTPGTGLPTWAAGLLRASSLMALLPGLERDGGPGGALPSDSSASPLNHWLKQVTWPCPRSRGEKSIVPTLRLWQGCGCRQDTDPGPSSIHPHPAIWVSLSEVADGRGAASRVLQRELGPGG